MLPISQEDSTIWLNTAEAAERLGVSEASVRRWSDRGLLPVNRVGRRGDRRFRAADVEQFGVLIGQAVPGAGGRGRVHVGGLTLDVPCHLATVYESDAGRLRVSLPFLAEGLKAGDPCYLVGRDEILEAFLDGLRRIRGVDVDAALAQGRLRLSGGPGPDAEAGVKFWDDALWSAMELRPAMIRVVAEMSQVRDNFINEAEMLTFEVGVNPTVKSFPAAAICQYDAREFSALAILRAFRAHPDLFGHPAGTFLVS